MICLKDKSTMAISCHLILVVGFLFISFFVNVWFLNNAKSSVKEAATVVHRVSGLKASVSSFSFNSSAFYLFSVFVFFIIILTVKDTNNMWPLWSNVIYAIKKKKKHVYWGCDTTGDPERLFRLCNQSTMCKCYHFFSLKEERCLYRVNLCALKEMCFFKV